MAAVQQEDKTAKGEDGVENEEDGLRKGEAVSVSADVLERMREMEERMSGVVERMEKVIETAKGKDREIKLLKEKCRCSDLIIEGLGNQLVELKLIVNSNKYRIGELEIWKVEREDIEKCEESRAGEREGAICREGRVCSVEDRVSADGVEERDSGDKDSLGGGRGAVRDSKQKAGRGRGLIEQVEGAPRGASEYAKDGKAIEKSEKIGVRDYFSCIPTALSESEYIWEMEERKKRKKNLRIKGIRTVEKGIREEVKNAIKKFLGMEV